MSRSECSIFDSNKEAAHTLTLVAKGMINVDDFPKEMISGTSKVMLEVSGRFLLEPDESGSCKEKDENSPAKEEPETKKGEVIHNAFGKGKAGRKKSGEPGA